MRNCDFFRTPEELESAFEKICGPHRHCEECPLYKIRNGLSCRSVFPYMEHEEPKPTKRRPYTRDELLPLVGKRLDFTNLSSFGKTIEGHTLIMFECEGGFTKVCGITQEELIASDATVDGKPFGVEVEE